MRRLPIYALMLSASLIATTSSVGVGQTYYTGYCTDPDCSEFSLLDYIPSCDVTYDGKCCKCDLWLLEMRAYGDMQPNYPNAWKSLSQFDLDNDNDCDIDDVTEWLATQSVNLGDVNFDGLIDKYDEEVVHDNFGVSNAYHWEHGNFWAALSHNGDVPNSAYTNHFLDCVEDEIENDPDTVDIFDTVAFQILLLFDVPGSHLYNPNSSIIDYDDFPMDLNWTPIAGDEAIVLSFSHMMINDPAYCYFYVNDTDEDLIPDFFESSGLWNEDRLICWEYIWKNAADTKHTFSKDVDLDPTETGSCYETLTKYSHSEHVVLLSAIANLSTTDLEVDLTHDDTYSDGNADEYEDYDALDEGTWQNSNWSEGDVDMNLDFESQDVVLILADEGW